MIRNQGNARLSRSYGGSKPDPHIGGAYHGLWSLGKYRRTWIDCCGGTEMTPLHSCPRNFIRPGTTDLEDKAHSYIITRGLFPAKSEHVPGIPLSCKTCPEQIGSFRPHKVLPPIPKPHSSTTDTETQRRTTDPEC